MLRNIVRLKGKYQKKEWFCVSEVHHVLKSYIACVIGFLCVNRELVLRIVVWLD